MPKSVEEFEQLRSQPKTVETFEAMRKKTKPVDFLKTSPQPLQPTTYLERITSVLPSATVAKPIESKFDLGDEPEEPSSAAAVFRNALRNIKGLVNLSAQAEGVTQMIERINSAGEFSVAGGFKQIAKELGHIVAPLGDIAKLHIYRQLPQELQDMPEIQERQSESYRNLGLDPLSVPMSVAMLLGGGMIAKGQIVPKAQYLKSRLTTKIPKVTKRVIPGVAKKLVPEAGKVYVPINEVRGAVDKAVKALDIKTAPETQAVKELGFVRRGDIAEADVRTGFAVKEIRRVMPDKAKREAITHAIENPKLRSGLSEIEKGVLNEVNRFYKEGFKIAQENDVINSALENYVTHVWKRDAKFRLFSGRFISPRTPFAKQRKIPTIAEGKNKGLTPLTEDVTELMEIWSRSVHRAIANKRYLDNLKVMTAEDGNLLIQPATSAPSNFISFDHPSLTRYIWRGKGKKGALVQMGVKVHPDIAGPIEVAFGRGWNPQGKWSQRVFNAYTALDRAAKKSILTISLFHYHALSESAIATGQTPLAFVRGVAKLANNEELVVRAKRSGLQIGGTPDVARQSLRFERVPALKQTIGKIIEKNDKVLWDNIHAGGKIEIFDRLTRDALTNKKYSHLKPSQIDRVVSEFINDAYGGLDWEAMGVSAKKQWLLQRSMLAPDWTTSQVRVFKGMFRIGEKGTPRRLSGQLYRAYWRRAIMYNYGGANALNYTFTAWKAGDPSKGHFMMQNAPGHRFQLELPYNGPDDKPRWIQVGKQFMEPFRYAEDLIEGKPLRTISAKMSPTARIVLGNIFNRRYPGGPRLYQKDDKAYMKYLKSLGYTAESVAPIPAQQYLDMFKGRKTLEDAIISSLGFPVKKDYKKPSRSSGRSGGR